MENIEGRLRDTENSVKRFDKCFIGLERRGKNETNANV